MIAILVLPAVAALAVGLPTASRHRRLHPRLSARALAVAAAALGLAVIGAVGTVAVGFLAGIPWIQNNFAWCRSLARTHARVPQPVGLLALAILAVMSVAGVAAWRRARRELHGGAGDAGSDLEVLEEDRPDAYAMGGGGGRIVVTSGMLRLLDPAEQTVLFAHERAHLRHRHHRYATLAIVASAAVPPLGFVTRRLRLALERWADEEAAIEVGDRRLVARAIIRAALGRTDYTSPAAGGTASGLSTLGVAGRVEALLLPAPESLGRPLSALAVVAVGTVVAIAGSALQVHHLVELGLHVCAL
ncbi:MAG: M48 family metalloprotease [Acidimicrobiia bacterium]